MGKETCGAAACKKGCMLESYYQAFLNSVGTPDRQESWLALAGAMRLAEANECHWYDYYMKEVDGALS